MVSVLSCHQWAGACERAIAYFLGFALELSYDNQFKKCDRPRYHQPKNLHSRITMLHNLQQSHQQEIQTITQVLAKITSRTADQIKPLLDAMLKQLIEPQQRPFYETATPTEWSIAFQEWVDSHRTLNLPTLSDEAISRESIYGDRG
ncbi:hypothetical protein [Microcoleus sp. CAWBG58]|uniref:hypothetical protein n=1 Tax=Microcoleus sp. CAWBG58 TaxID=2841651 RepID=UPI0025FA973B|nr:hypothetical protein [Microcoleus sp. CAWBG58]